MFSNLGAVEPWHFSGFHPLEALTDKPLPAAQWPRNRLYFQVVAGSLGVSRCIPLPASEFMQPI